MRRRIKKHKLLIFRGVSDEFVPVFSRRSRDAAICGEHYCGDCHPSLAWLFKKIFFEKGEKKMQVSGNTWNDVYNQEMDEAARARMCMDAERLVKPCSTHEKQRRDEITKQAAMLDSNAPAEKKINVLIGMVARLGEETVRLQNELTAAHSRLDAQENSQRDAGVRLGGVMCEMQSIENNLDVFKRDTKSSVEILINSIGNACQRLERTVHDLKYQRADGPLDKLITAVQVPIAPPEIDLTKNSGKSV